MLFFSPSTCGFYSVAIHGQRTFTIIQPDWVHPQIEVPNLEYDPETSLDGPTIFIDDPHISAPTIEVVNPACQIPPDAVEITPEQHAALIEGQSTGKRIVADADGYPVLQDPPQLTPEQLRANALARIDAAHAQHINSLLGNPTEAERATWTRKQVMADAILSGAELSQADSAYLHALGATTDAARTAMATKVRDKVARYWTLVGVADHVRDVARDAVRAAQTADEINAALAAASAMADQAVAQLTGA